MTVYETLPRVCPSDRCAVALGIFDGLHRGHLAVINSLLGDGGKNGEPCVFTFSTRRGAPGFKTPGRLLTRAARDSILCDMGITRVFQPEFSDFKDMEPEAFVKDFLLGYLNAGAVFCGEDYRFGKNARADCTDLKALLPDVKVTVVAAVRDLGGPVSATRIRGFIQEGDMHSAARLLGRRFSFDSAVEHGHARGRQMGWPTINQRLPKDFVTPRFGVYASVATVEGKRMPSVTNIGVRPTVGGGQILAETYIQGFSGKLYGVSVPVELVELIRDERKFPDVNALRAQIKKDAEQAAIITGGDI